MKNSKIKVLLAGAMSLALLGSMNAFAADADWDVDDTVWTVNNGVYTKEADKNDGSDNDIEYVEQISGAIDFSFDMKATASQNPDDQTSSLKLVLRNADNNQLFFRIRTTMEGKVRIERQVLVNGKKWDPSSPLVNGKKDNNAEWSETSPAEVTVNFKRAAGSDTAVLTLKDKASGTVLATDTVTHEVLTGANFYDKITEDKEGNKGAVILSLGTDGMNDKIVVSNLQLTAATPLKEGATTAAGGTGTTAAGGSNSAATTAKNPTTGSALPLSAAGLTVVAAAALFVLRSRKSK